MSQAERTDECIFCQKITGDDEKNLVLYRGNYCFVVLNLFPYNNGHLMVAPYTHKGSLEELTKEERNEMMDIVALCLDVLKEGLNCHGFNVGMNIGKVAGAGVPDHLHIHIVPRWEGDTNFMPVIGDTKVIPQSLSSTYQTLRAVLDKKKWISGKG